MNENIKLFLEKLDKDPEAAAKMSAIRDPEEAYAFASSMQDGFTKEEFLSAMEELKTAMKNNEELTDEDLNKIAGGDDGTVSLVLNTIELTVMSGCLAAGAAAI
ncbi:MAG: Nif11-like leader peptide family RiPP precursor [Lachnospiraceae bacterium]|nr:Nif11-like leader peptide family RiPP precursor [Lachnospiraceae bacterium]